MRVLKLEIKVVIFSIKRGNYVNVSKYSNAAHDISGGFFLFFIYFLVNLPNIFISIGAFGNRVWLQ